MKTFLKIKEAATFYGIGRTLLYMAIKNKELRAYKPNGRDFILKVEEIEKWIQSKQA
jgi:excisionase family DNA binding protein